MNRMFLLLTWFEKEVLKMSTNCSYSETGTRHKSNVLEIHYTIFCSFFLFFFSIGNEKVDKDKSTSKQKTAVTKNVSPCKSDDSGYNSGSSFDENPKVEALVSNLNQDFMEKKSIGAMGRDSANFKAVKSRINRNLCM